MRSWIRCCYGHGYPQLCRPLDFGLDDSEGFDLLCRSLNKSNRCNLSSPVSQCLSGCREGRIFINNLGNHWKTFQVPTFSCEWLLCGLCQFGPCAMILIFRRLFARGSVFLREQQLPSHTQRHCLSSTVDQAEIDHFNRLSSSSLKPNNNNDDDAAEPCACDAPGGVWWDASGPLKTLHHVNTSRMAYARNWITRHFAKDSTSERNSELPLSLSLLDVGCGGGLATEALYRMGERAEHTWRTQASSGDSFELKGGTDRCAKGWRCVGVDAAEAGIAAAKDHFARAYCNQLVSSDAVKAGSSLEYRLGHLRKTSFSHLFALNFMFLY